MPNKVHTVVTFTGSPEDFRRACLVRAQRKDPILSRGFEFTLSAEGTAAFFLSAWSPDIELAWVLSCLLPCHAVEIQWLEPINCDEGVAILLAGELIKIRYRAGDEIKEWSRVTKTIRTSRVICEDQNIAPHGAYTEQVISEAPAPDLSIADVIPDCEPLDIRLIDESSSWSDETGCSL